MAVFNVARFYSIQEQLYWKSGKTSETTSPLEWTLALSVDVHIHAVRVSHIFNRTLPAAWKSWGIGNWESHKTSETTSPVEWTLALSVDVHVYALRVLHIFNGTLPAAQKNWVIRNWEAGKTSETMSPLEWALALSVDVCVYAVRVLPLQRDFANRAEKLGNQAIRD